MFPQAEDDLHKILDSRHFQITAYHYGGFVSGKTVYCFRQKRNRVKVRVISYRVYPIERHTIYLTLSEMQRVREAVLCAWGKSKEKAGGIGGLFQVDYYLHNAFRKIQLPRIDFNVCGIESIMQNKLPIDPDDKVDLSKPVESE